MKKFNYKKWLTENKTANLHGYSYQPINEQVGAGFDLEGESNSNFNLCYSCPTGEFWITGSFEGISAYGYSTTGPITDPYPQGDICSNVLYNNGSFIL